MRKFLLILFINLALFHFYCAAQKFSIEPFAGYNFSPAGSIIGINNVYNFSTGFSTLENLKGSFGEGVSFGVNASYAICTHVALNLGVSVLSGKKITESEDGYYSNGADTETFKPFAIKMLPGVTFSFNEDKRIQPYLRAELALNVFSSFKDEATGYELTGMSASSGTTYAYYDEVITKHGGINLGYGAALGVLFKITKVFGITAEVNCIYQNYGFTKGQETSYDGQNIRYGTTYIYQDNINTGTSQNSSSAIELKQYYPFSSIGIRTGVRFMF